MQIYMALLVLGLVMFVAALLLGAIMQHITERRLHRYRPPAKQARDARRLNVRRATPPSGLQLRFVPPAADNHRRIGWDSE